MNYSHIGKLVIAMSWESNNLSMNGVLITHFSLAYQNAIKYSLYEFRIRSLIMEYFHLKVKIRPFGKFFISNINLIYFVKGQDLNWSKIINIPPTLPNCN